MYKGWNGERKRERERGIERGREEVVKTRNSDKKGLGKEKKK